MKKVAGFHSLDSQFLDAFLFSFRSGFGTRDFQKETSAIVAGAVPECRMPLECNGTLRKAAADGLARATVRMAILCNDIVTLLAPPEWLSTYLARSIRNYGAAEPLI